MQFKNGDWRCFYVGQSDNLSEQLIKHLSSCEEIESVKNNVDKYTCGYEYAEVKNKAKRNGIEKYLYDYYKPICNKIAPQQVDAIETNLPKI